MGLLEQQLSNGLLNKDPLRAQTSNPKMLAQALKARQTTPRNALTGQGLLDTAAIGLSPIPVIGDLLGLGADANRFINEPESRTPLNFGLAALGLIPFVPPLVSAGLGKFAQSQGKTLAQAPTGPARNQAGAIVYHGSPHKFDAFDSSKIGTGEGAQAYGHGLYFAENPEVSKTYMRTQLNNAPELEQMALRAGASPDAANTIAQWYHKTKDSKSFDKFLGIMSEAAPSPHIQKFRDSIRQQEPALRKAWESFSDKGNLYKVDLPDEAIAKMLDWDSPLSKQPDAVKVAAKDLGLKPNATGKDIYQALSNQARDMAIIKGKNAQTTMGASQANASSDLLGFGVPGIRYLDGGSRSPWIIDGKPFPPTAEKATSNFVVFPGNEGLLKILERQ